VRTGGTGPGVAARAAWAAWATRAVRTSLPDGPPVLVVGPAGARAARAGGRRRPSRTARPVPATAGCGHGVYPGTVGIPGMVLGWLCSRPWPRLRKCSRGWTTMPKAAARCASE